MSSPSGATRTPSTVLIEGLEHRAKCAVFDGLPDLCTCGAIGLSSFRQGWSPATHRDPAQMGAWISGAAATEVWSCEEPTPDALDT